MAYTHLFFDLDGTLTDSRPGIVGAIHYALKQMGRNDDIGDEYRFLGPPLIDSMQEYFGMDFTTATTAVKEFRDYYGRRGLYENRLFDGVRDLLRDCVAAGKQCVLATSKGEPFARTILEHFGILPYFSFVAGAVIGGGRDDKADVLRHALENVDPIPAGRGIMVGDKRHDVAGAHEVGLPCIGVLYGYGGPEELRKAGADFTVETVDALRDFLLG